MSRAPVGSVGICCERRWANQDRDRAGECSPSHRHLAINRNYHQSPSVASVLHLDPPTHTQSFILPPRQRTPSRPKAQPGPQCPSTTLLADKHC